MSKSWRLTKRIEGGVHRVCHKGHTDFCYGCADRTTCNHDIFERLAQYEDTDRLPELIGDIHDEIVRKLPRTPEETKKGFWADGYDNIMCGTEAEAKTIARFLSEMGVELVLVVEHIGDNDPNSGWFSVEIVKK